MASRNQQAPFVWAVVAVALLAAPTAHGAIIVSDGFDSSGATRVDDANDPLDVNWFRLTSATNPNLTLQADATIGTGNALDVDNTGTFTRMLAPFAATTLGAVGSGTETIRFGFDFRLTQASSTAQGAGFRFGLFNSNTTAVTADNQVGTTTNDFGYGVQIGTGAAGVTILREPTNSGGISGGGQDDSNITASGSTPVNIADTLKHSALFTVTRTGTGLAFAVSIDGVQVATAADNAALGFTFDEMVFGNGNNTVDYRIDNVVVETVPEPTAVGVAAAGGLLVTLRRHRRRDHAA
jgi:hypothetical protein